MCLVLTNMHRTYPNHALPDIVLGTVCSSSRPRLNITVEHLPTNTSLSCSGGHSGDSGFNECEWPVVDNEDSFSACFNSAPCSPVTPVSPSHRKSSFDDRTTHKTVANATNDLKLISNAYVRVKQCGFYYPNMNQGDAKISLRQRPVGSFLIRDSSHPCFLFSLTAKTARGTTSVRIEYKGGFFRLDCEEHAKAQMARFPCVLQLIEYYMKQSDSRSDKCVWLETSGRRDTPVVLGKPVVKEVLSLKHLSRLKVNSCVPLHRRHKLPQLPLDDEHLSYLEDYPASV